MPKYSYPDGSYEFQELSNELCKEDKPYDSITLVKIENNNKWLQRSGWAVSKDLRGGSGHNLVGSASRINERPFTSTNQVSSFLQIPWYRNVGSTGVRVRMYCRIGNYQQESEPGSYTATVNPFIQVAFNKEESRTWNDEDIYEDGMKNLRTDNIADKVGEWQWVQLDYIAEREEDESKRTGGLVGEWDILHVGFGNQMIIPDDGFSSYVDYSTNGESSGRQYAVKTTTDYFTFDSAASAPAIDGWQVNAIQKVILQVNGDSSITTVAQSPVFDTACTMAYHDSVAVPTSVEYQVMCIMPSNNSNTIPASSAGTTTVIAKIPASYIQVRAIEFEELGSSLPNSIGTRLLLSERSTANRAPYALSKKITNIESNKVCLVPFSSGYKTNSTTAEFAGESWTDNKMPLRHGVTVCGDPRSGLFDEIATSPKLISKVTFAINHTGFYNDIPYDSAKTKPLQTILPEGDVTIEKTTSDMLDEGCIGYIKFIATVQQLSANGATWAAIATKTFYKETRFIIVNGDVSWASQHVYANQLGMMLDKEYKETFCYREGQFSMPGYGGTMGDNDRLLLMSDFNNTLIDLDLSDAYLKEYDHKRPIRCQLSIEIPDYLDATYHLQGGTREVEHGRGINLPIDGRAFVNLVGVSVWGE